MPITHVTFFIGCLALAGFPGLSGFWSKDAIVAAVHEKGHELEHATHSDPHSDSEEHASHTMASSLTAVRDMARP